MEIVPYVKGMQLGRKCRWVYKSRVASRLTNKGEIKEPSSWVLFQDSAPRAVSYLPDTCLIP